MVVNSRALGATNVWAEQTYAVAGAASGGTFTTTTGALYGGRNVAASDNALGSINTAEHVNWVGVAGTNAANINYGFSFSAVTSTRDGDDDAGNPDRSVQGSLRQFIGNSNALAGVQTVNFSIGAEGSPQTIALSAALPTITDVVKLDASTQAASGYAGTPLIELNGAGAGAGADGFLIGPGSNGSMVRGFVINRFEGDGVHVEGDNTIIVGNYIGTDALGGGSVAGNGGYGVHLLSDLNRVGGTGTGERNVISGNGIDGIAIQGASDNVVLRNYIGTNAAGTAALGNAEDGVWLDNAVDNTIGGAAAGDGNLIAWNGWSGIAITSGSGNLVQHNEIANNTEAGVAIESGVGHAVLSNSIHSNATGLGIDLGDDGVTANDYGDVDLGTNLGMNTPEIYSVTVAAGNVTVTGEARPGARVQFFEAAADPLGTGEGRILLAEIVFAGVTPGLIDPTARQFSLTFAAGPLALGDQLTATATDGAGNTSEFSSNVTALAPNTAPLITSNGGGAAAVVTVAENTLAITDVDATDAEAPPPGPHVLDRGRRRRHAVHDRPGHRHARLPGRAGFRGPRGPRRRQPLRRDRPSLGRRRRHRHAGDRGHGHQRQRQRPADRRWDGARAGRELALGTAVYDVNEAFTGTDADRDGQGLTYSVAGSNTANAFTIDPVTGAITVSNPAALDFETTPLFTLTVNAIDGLLNDTAQITVSLVDANDAPTGSVAIAGLVQEERRPADTSGIVEPDGLGPLVYLWERFHRRRSHLDAAREHPERHARRRRRRNAHPRDGLVHRRRRHAREPDERNRRSGRERQRCASGRCLGRRRGLYRERPGDAGRSGTHGERHRQRDARGRNRADHRRLRGGPGRARIRPRGRYHRRVERRRRHAHADRLGTARRTGKRCSARSPDLNASEDPAAGARTVEFVVHDGTTSCGTVTRTVNVTPVADPPAGTDRTITVNEDTTRSFAAADFGFSDVEGQAFAAVRIDAISLPAGATLRLGGVDVNPGDGARTTSPGFTSTPPSRSVGSEIASIRTAANAWPSTSEKPKSAAANDHGGVVHRDGPVRFRPADEQPPHAHRPRHRRRARRAVVHDDSTVRGIARVQIGDRAEHVPCADAVPSRSA